MSGTGPIETAIQDKLTARFAPERLQIVNESHLHAGHHNRDSGEGGSFDGVGETHFRVRIVSAAFGGMSRLERHRAINETLAEELAPNKVHALAIEPAAPGETTRW
ncbi:BolA family transcriptional regulator [Notoacmeibacter sp. MSK16QG-6]|uniref:BolA family protein n=1 Tax=Notoacmeibacter sp. MSK16QG-6 TaxID=2957982 RepID=UPI00209F3C7A|nr:BolA family protein [Notoacmeibacter sp. MSK16QG-6]MCP1200006.1 BolA family transcriptional regulator [Notoacmeibacter sp. MSK16QG-6]